MEKQLIVRLHKGFEDCAYQTDDGVEYWFVRDLQELLDYRDWRNFVQVCHKCGE